VFSAQLGCAKPGADHPRRAQVAKKPTSTRRNWAKDDIRALKTVVKENVIASEIALTLAVQPAVQSNES
jgi:hypothetical protein